MFGSYGLFHRVKHWFNDRYQHWKIGRLIKKGYIDEDFHPRMCIKCKSTHIVQVVKGMDGGHVSEYDLKCGKCGTSMGYWAYGSYMPWY